MSPVCEHIISTVFENWIAWLFGKRSDDEWFIYESDDCFQLLCFCFRRTFWISFWIL